MHSSLQDVGHRYSISEYYVMLYFDPLSYLVAHIPFSFRFSNVLECTSVLIDIAIILHKRWKPISYLLELALNRDYSLVLSFNFQPMLPSAPPPKYLFAQQFRFSHISRKPICMPMMSSLHWSENRALCIFRYLRLE